ncbi:MAG: hypothetical protein EOP53_26615 [Sphingobacteriales bacterium]|nr:MAG: hypothetical protein EOP53_26615 [Sphingobacteriales bacterium]
MFKDIYGSGEYGNEVRALSKSEGYGVFHLQVPQRDKEPENIYSVFIPVAYPSQADMVYALQMMNRQFTILQKQREYKVEEFKVEALTNGKLLKKKTILIDPSQLSSKTTVEELKKSYNGDMEVADYVTVNETVVNENASYAYVMIVPMEMPSGKIGQSKVSVMLMHLVIDAEDGKVLGKAKPARMNYDKIADDITRKEVKDYMEVKCFYDGGDKYISRLDYGQVIKRGKDSNIRDDDGKDLLFNSPIDCINKLKNYGYELFQTYSKQNGKDDSIAVYVLKRK